MLVKIKQKPSKEKFYGVEVQLSFVKAIIQWKGSRKTKVSASQEENTECADSG